MRKKNFWKRRSWNRYDFSDELTKKELKAAKRLEDIFITSIVLMIFGIVISYLFFTDLPEDVGKSIILWQRIGIGCIGISLIGFFIFIFGRYRRPEVPPAEDNIDD